MLLSSAVPYVTGFAETIAADDILLEKEKVYYLPAYGLEWHTNAYPV
ncbi:MAG: hypothetical protein K2K21_06420 [Lachnospiraceae bacterium]|nr:hypothetical protein [Lachnospiraceae bacterium]